MGTVWSATFPCCGVAVLVRWSALEIFGYQVGGSWVGNDGVCWETRHTSKRVRELERDRGLDYGWV